MSPTNSSAAPSKLEVGLITLILEKLSNTEIEQGGATGGSSSDSSESTGNSGGSGSGEFAHGKVCLQLDIIQNTISQ